MAQEYWIVLGEGFGHKAAHVYGSESDANFMYTQFKGGRPDWDWQVIPVVRAPAEKPAEPAPDVEGPHDYVPTVRQLSRHVTDLRVALQRQMEKMRADYDAAMVKQNDRLAELEAAHEVDGKLLERIEKLEKQVAPTDASGRNLREWVGDIVTVANGREKDWATTNHALGKRVGALEQARDQHVQRMDATSSVLHKLETAFYDWAGTYQPKIEKLEEARDAGLADLSGRIDHLSGTVSETMEPIQHKVDQHEKRLDAFLTRMHNAEGRIEVERSRLDMQEKWRKSFVAAIDELRKDGKALDNRVGVTERKLKGAIIIADYFDMGKGKPKEQTE